MLSLDANHVATSVKKRLAVKIWTKGLQNLLFQSIQQLFYDSLPFNINSSVNCVIIDVGAYVYHNESEGCVL